MARRSVRADVPVWVLVPAALGLALVVLPIIGMIAKIDWGEFLGLITSDTATTALTLSLRTAAASTALCLILGVPMAVVLARADGIAARLARAVVLVPLVLPPVVGGIALLYTFGRMGLVGRQLDTWGVHLAFSTSAVVLAQTFVALPFLVMSLEGALRTSGDRYQRIAATLGARPSTVFWRVTLPLALPAIAAGTVLAFARALGEFGATLTFAGSYPGVTRTLPLEIYLQRDDDPNAAVALSLVLIAVAVLVIVAVSRRGAAGLR